MRRRGELRLLRDPRSGWINASLLDMDSMAFVEALEHEGETDDTRCSWSWNCILSSWITLWPRAQDLVWRHAQL